MIHWVFRRQEVLKHHSVSPCLWSINSLKEHVQGLLRKVQRQPGKLQSDILKSPRKTQLWSLPVFKIRYWTVAHMVFRVYAPNLFYAYILRNLVTNNYFSQSCLWPYRNLQIFIFGLQREKTAKWDYPEFRKWFEKQGNQLYLIVSCGEEITQFWENRQWWRI